MNKRKTLTIITIILGVALILFGLFFPKLKTEDKKTTKKDDKENTVELIKAELDKIIEEMIAKDVDADVLNKKYSIDYMGDAYLPFIKLNTLGFKPSFEVETEDLKACLTVTDNNYDDIIKAYKDNLDYKITIDEEKQEINLEVKTYYLKSYELVLSKLTDIYSSESNEEVSESSFFEARCKAIKKMKPHIKDFANKDDYLSIRFTYSMEEDKFLLHEYAPLGFVLSGEHYLDKTEEEVIEMNQKFEAQAKEIYEAN